MKKLVIDIETRRAGGLSPFRGKIVTIGVINTEDGRSCAMYEVPGQKELIIEKDGARTYMSGSEKQILEKFWTFFDSDARFISFNGRQFDGPFLLLRSAINGVVPKRDLVGYRYGFHPNCDLREVLNFFGTTSSKQFKFNLDLACKVFGVPTSKSEGVDGRSVETWYRAGRHRDIADYCLEDVRATAELYEKLAPTLLIFNREFREAEERDRKMRPDPNQGVLIPSVLPPPEEPFLESEAQTSLLPTEQSFMDSVTQTSLALTSALDAPRAEVVPPSKHQAVILEKLAVQSPESEDEIPSGF
jgi:DNA polymerase III epsilon subunit-like protein